MKGGVTGLPAQRLIQAGGAPGFGWRRVLIPLLGKEDSAVPG